MEAKYWLVGASWKGVDHQDERFLEQGIWMLGWKKGHQYARAKGIAPGDRLAIKRLLGRSKKGIRIMHLGVVRGVVLDTNKVLCTVNWVATHLDRKVESGGALGSVHGPYVKSDTNYKQWIEEIFSL